MEQKNYQFLADALTKIAGTDALSGDLKTQMEKADKLGLKDFTFSATKPFDNGEQMQYDFKFSKGKKEQDGNYYFFNAYQATLTKGDSTTITQEFNMFQQKGFTVDEARNLLKGNSVHREMNQRGAKEPVQRWYRIDFTQTNDRGNFRMVSVNEKDVSFNLAKELSKIPMSNASQGQKEELMAAIQRGDTPTVTNRNNESLTIKARPQEGTLVLYNAKGEEVKQTNNNKLRVVETPKEQVGEDKNKAQATELPKSTKLLMEQGQGDGKTDQSQKRKVG